LKNQPPAPKSPRDLHGWIQLAQTAIARAEKTQDRRLTRLRDALSSGKAEGTLRQMGIICEADVIREFPVPA
jgi:hypothetical protein